MREFKLRSDLKRSVVGDFALPLGLEAIDLEPPVQGYTIAFTPGALTSDSDSADGEEEPDGYAFHIVVSHERLAPLIRDALALLPPEVVPIVEIGSRDAYRSVDVYLGEELIPTERFLDVWRAIEPIVIEDGSIGIGANSEDPWIEVFLDSWKGLTIHVDVDRRDEVEAMLRRHALEEVPETWPDVDENELNPSTRSREVLDLADELSPDIDELLLGLREVWELELNIDPDNNVDDGGRELGMTLWHAIVLTTAADGDPNRGAYLSIWASARSIGEMEMLIDLAVEDQDEWIFDSLYSIDRVAYDERPDALANLSPRQREAKVHLVDVDPWGDSEQDGGDRDGAGPNGGPDGGPEGGPNGGGGRGDVPFGGPGMFHG